MAFGKTSKKTEKTKSEVPVKTKSTGTRSRTSPQVAETPTKSVAGMTQTKTSKKVAAVVARDSNLQDRLVTETNIAATNIAATKLAETKHDASMAMAATAGYASDNVAAPDQPLIGETLSSGHLATQTIPAMQTAPATHSVPAAHTNGHRHVSQEAIADLAYSYWVERGYTHGSSEEDWKRAEEQLRKR